MPIYDRVNENKYKTFGLMIIFIILVFAIGWAIGYFTGWGIYVSIIALMFALVMNFVGYFYSDKIAIAMSGAKPASENEYQFYHNTVEGLCIAAGLPKPKLFILNDNSINAFATGRDPAHSSLAVTAGALEKLKRIEFEGVVSHELSHIKNRDILVMSIAAALVGVIIFLCDIAYRMIWFGGFGGRDERRNKNAILMIVGIVLILLAPLLAQLLKFAISRKREFLADADGALLTRYPDGLASALERIKNETYGLRNANNATAHLFFANPFKKKDWFVNLFSTHPDINERIKALREM